MPSEEGGWVRCRVHLANPPERVYGAIATEQGRARFWAESARDLGNGIEFRFPNGASWRGRILEASSPERFSLEYYGGTITTFELRPDGRGGTDLLLLDRGISQTDLEEVRAGWVSVLLALKAAVDFGVDLRNHDPDRSWDQGYVDN